jgi:hypothetical protein
MTIKRCIIFYNYQSYGQLSLLERFFIESFKHQELFKKINKFFPNIFIYLKNHLEKDYLIIFEEKEKINLKKGLMILYSIYLSYLKFSI